MNVDLSKIRFILTGEPTAAEVNNRPVKDLIKEIDKIFDSLSIGGSATLVEDFDPISGNGFYTNGNNGVGSHSPENMTFVSLLHINASENTASQFAFENATDGRVFWRNKVEGIWGGWGFFYSSVHNYGLGSTDNIYINDVRAIRGSSFEYQHPSAVNKVGGVNGALINAQPHEDYAVQIAYVGGNRVVISGKHNGVFSGDLEILHSGNSVNPTEFGLGSQPYTVSDWDGIVGGSFCSANNATNNPTSDGFDVESIMSTTYQDTSGDYKGIIGISKQEPRSFGRSSGNLNTVGWNTPWFEHFTTYNQNYLANSNMVANVGFGYYIKNNVTITLPENAKDGDSVRFRRKIGAEPRIKSPTGVNIIISRRSDENITDNEIIFDINNEIILTFNGINWEV